MKLYDFQNTGKDFLKARKAALLADSMGLGKSCQAIMAAEELGLSSILIICPASVKYNWPKEIKKWLPNADIHVLASRKPLPTTIPQYTVVNYDILHSRNIFLYLISRHYDLLICDEAHYLKNNRAKRTKCVYYPKGLKDRADRVWLLTGTPVLNRPVELFSHLKALTPNTLGEYSSYIQYCKRFCAARETRWGVDVSGASNIPELAKLLDGFMLRRLKKDVLEQLPEVTYQTILLDPGKKLKILTVKERGAYAKEKNGVLGALSSIRRESGIAKVPLVVQHLQDVLEDKQKAVVFAYHRDVISTLVEGCRAYSPVVLTGATPTDKRQAAIESFKMDPKSRLFIGQIEAAGVGIDGLQDVCDTVIFAEMSWVPGQIHQAIGRCHRIGQKNPVLVQFLVVPDSIDEEISETIARKEKIIDQLIKPTTKEEPEMSMENELKRIADALESLAGSKADSETVTTTTTEAKATPKAKKAKPVDVKAVPVEEGGMTPAQLMAYCNAKLVELTPAERQPVVKQIVATFKEEFGVTSIKDIPADRVEDAKDAFDAVLGGE